MRNQKQKDDLLEEWKETKKKKIDIMKNRRGKKNSKKSRLDFIKPKAIIPDPPDPEELHRAAAERLFEEIMKTID